MVRRRFWLDRIAAAWKRRSVVWLSGVRRAGKTTIAKSLPGVAYFDCELPSVRRRIEDPETFLDGLRGRRVVLDEVHRLPNPSEVLKIAADHYPNVRVLATGSSTLGASAKFKDTLTGRRIDVWLTPLMTADLDAFKSADIGRRFLRGGLPEHFLAGDLPADGFRSWMDNYWAKDIQTLFRIRDHDSFERFTELLAVQSGGMFEAAGFARSCGVSRGTIGKYLHALTGTHVAHVVRPFTSRRAAEIVAAPKVYFFDTGFVCACREWEKLRPEDHGVLWEHYVLNEIHARAQSRRVQYWRDKIGHEIAFIFRPRSARILALECKWSADSFNPSGALAFHRNYPGARIVVVAHNVNEPYARDYDGVGVEFAGIKSLPRYLDLR